MIGEEDQPDSKAANPQKRRSFAPVKGMITQKTPIRLMLEAGTLTDASDNTQEFFPFRSMSTTIIKNPFVEASGSNTTSQSAALDSSSNPSKPRTRSETTPKSIKLGSSRSPASSMTRSNSNAKAKRTCGLRKQEKKAQEAAQITASHHSLRAFLRLYHSNSLTY